jgi:hypothetical protein
MEKFGWKPGMIFAPEWHEWFAQFQQARNNGAEKPSVPETDYYMKCPDCDGEGEKIATVEEFVAHHLTSYQMELLKNHNIKFSKETVSITHD